MVNSGNLPSLHLQHRRRLEAVRDDAISVAGTAAKISQAMAQVLEQGGTANIQSQMAYLTGALARITKDWGVIEHLQSLGAYQKKPPSVR